MTRLTAAQIEEIRARWTAIVEGPQMDKLTARFGEQDVPRLVGHIAALEEECIDRSEAMNKDTLRIAALEEEVAGNEVALRAALVTMDAQSKTVDAAEHEMTRALDRLVAQDAEIARLRKRLERAVENCRNARKHFMADEYGMTLAHLDAVMGCEEAETDAREQQRRNDLAKALEGGSIKDVLALRKKPPNVAGMFAPNEDPRGGIAAEECKPYGDEFHPHNPPKRTISHDELRASMSPEVFDKKMEDARQLMRDFRRPGRD